MRVVNASLEPLDFIWFTNRQKHKWNENSKEKLFTGSRIQIRDSKWNWLFVADDERREVQAFVLLDRNVAMFQFQFSLGNQDFEEECLNSLVLKLRDRNSCDQAYPVLIYQSGTYTTASKTVGEKNAEHSNSVFRTYWNGGASFVTLEGSVNSEGGITTTRWRNKTKVATEDLANIIADVEEELRRIKAHRQSPGGLGDNWEYQTNGCLKTLVIGTFFLTGILGGIASVIT